MDPIAPLKTLSGFGVGDLGSVRASDLARLRAPELGGPEEGWLRGPNAPRVNGPSFGETLTEAIHQVDQSQKAADEQITAFVAGEQENLHEVMIAMNQAELSLQLMTEVRNRVLETYQELMRMQV